MDYEGSEKADSAHVRWQVYGSADHACSDQFSSGIPIGSLYYPRIVTAILWLEEHAAGQNKRRAPRCFRGSERSMKPLRKFDIFSYGIGDFGINLHFQMINFFFAYFLTDIFGIPFFM